MARLGSDSRNQIRLKIGHLVGVITLTDKIETTLEKRAANSKLRGCVGICLQSLNVNKQTADEYY